MLTMQVLPVPEHPAPLQPVKVLPVVAVAFSVTLVPLGYPTLQTVPQYSPEPVELDTVPAPVPDLLTVSV